jgi:pimeloyl-ACP methyl ester carboxylesterase
LLFSRIESSSANNNAIAANQGVPLADAENVELIGQIGGYAFGVAVVGNNAYIASGDGLRIINVSNPLVPTEVGFYDTPGYALGVEVVENYAYVADHASGLRVINVSSPTTPTEIGYYDTPGIARGVAVSGNYAFVADSYDLRIIDISSAASPIEVGTYDGPGEALGVAVADDYAYFADGDAGGLRVIETSNPAFPTEIGSYDTPGTAYGVTVVSSYAYIADGSTGLRVVNVSNPASPTEVGFYATPGSAWDAVVANNYAYIADDFSGLRIIDIANPAAANEVGYYDTPTPGFARDVAVSGGLIYVADAYGGLLILRFAGSKYTISGRIVDGGGTPISGVVVSAGRGGSAITNPSGSYTITNVITGTYTLTPTKSGYTFSPPSRTVSVPPDVTGQGFVGTFKPPIILLPGIMGSRLSNTPSNSLGCILRPQGEIWLNLLGLVNPDYYNSRLASLRLKDDGQRPLNDCDNIQSTGVITGISLAGFPVMDFYGEFATTMQTAGYQVFGFGYDWRLNLEENAQRLDTFVNALGSPKVILVGHSMGGLLAREYVSYSSRAAKVDTVISVSTPYWGAPRIAKFMRSGTSPVPFDILINDQNLWQVMRNSTGVMQLLPSDAYFQQLGSYYVDDTSQLLTIIDTLGFFTSKGQNQPLMAQARNFHVAIDDFRNNLPVGVKYYVLTANHLPTVNHVREHRCWELLGTCWQETSYLMGDNAVPWPSARLSGIAGDWSGTAQVCNFSSGNVNEEHGSLLSDDFVIADIQRLLQGLQPARCQFVDSQSQMNQIQSTPDPFVQLAIWGHTRVQVQDAMDRVTGVNTQGWVVTEIPTSTISIGDGGTFIVLPVSGVYTLSLQSDSDQPLRFQVNDFRASSMDGEFTTYQRAAFVDVPMVISGTATMPIDFAAGLPNLSLQVFDQGGSPLVTLGPTGVLNAQQSQDYASPTTTITVTGTPDSLGFYSGEVTMTLSATDSGTGVYQTQYSLDEGATWETYAAPVSFMAEQTPVVYARSVDLGGNQEYPGASQRLRPVTLYLPLIRR